tara:strand:- start:1486 stop:1623 length:138 start_codon:yes stop_codon:yes gene_type:complete
MPTCAIVVNRESTRPENFRLIFFAVIAGNKLLTTTSLKESTAPPP